MIELLLANSLQIPLADKTVQMVATSPPYWGLRDYQLPPRIWGGSPTCAHVWQEHIQPAPNGITHDGGMTGETLSGNSSTRKPKRSDFCACGAWRGCFGLEPTPELYIAHLVEIFREVRRVLRDDGVVWLNLGDSYANNPSNGRAEGKKLDGGLPHRSGIDKSNISSLKSKDLVGIPWMAALALRADGWYLRRDVIWSKPNPMPESVIDRPTTAHEYIFLLSKQERYFYDGEAIKEPIAESTAADHRLNLEGYEAGRPERGFPADRPSRGAGLLQPSPTGRNRRSVWTVATNPYAGAHFATWPPAIVEPMIKAGSSPQACEHCGAPWERIIEKGYRAPANESLIAEMEAKGVPRQKANLYGDPTRDPTRDPKLYAENPDKTIGWKPTCKCKNSTGAGRCIVLDPFAGSGTTLLVARKLGRSAIGLDLSFTYLQECARERLSLTALDEWENGIQTLEQDFSDLPLFLERRIKT